MVKQPNFMSFIQTKLPTFLTFNYLFVFQDKSFVFILLSSLVLLNLYLSLSLAMCAMVCTIWFPIAANQEHGLMAFGFSLYTGWVGTVFCLVGGLMLACSSDSSSPSSRPYQDNNHFYYSKQGGGNLPAAASSNNHAKSAHV